ncbi:hypothetical protein, conserved [Leishmania tarentolae]|uniref:Uncharacterized protein n=1 Tax=Leishmania tarentolae TaxID=5689 RepID=A0A640KRF7_LEITA|nr:hypothetical protein, conserved [Leishmania tarentolae]
MFPPLLPDRQHTAAQHFDWPLHICPIRIDHIAVVQVHTCHHCGEDHEKHLQVAQPLCAHSVVECAALRVETNGNRVEGVHVAVLLIVHATVLLVLQHARLILLDTQHAQLMLTLQLKDNFITRENLSDNGVPRLQSLGLCVDIGIAGICSCRTDSRGVFTFLGRAFKIPLVKSLVLGGRKGGRWGGGVPLRCAYRMR